MSLVGRLTREAPRIRRILLVAVLHSLAVGTVHAQDPPPADRTDALRVFLDCQFNCDDTYLRQEITVVNWVRDRTVADVHILVTTQQTGGGGREYTVKFIGQGRFVAVEQALRYFALPISSPDDIRKGIADVLRRGLVRYVSETAQASRLKITFAPEATAAAAAVTDPWNLWVFRTSVGGSVNGERSNAGRSIRASGSANRTTDAWKINLSANGNYRENTFELSDTETFTSVSRNVNADAHAVKSLTGRWSAALLANASKSTFLNYDLHLRAAPAVEYDIFPYAESTRRVLTLQYSVGFDSNTYKEETIFGKTTERLLDHRLDTSLALRQPWGTASASVNVSQYLTKPDKYNVSVFGATDIRLFKGFSFNVFTNIARTRDQIYLRAEGATPEEILVRQIQQATSYRYSLNFGITYSFGSIFNNVVNPRFGGGGGDFFFSF